MNNDDSFNDSDEIFNLYSSKKVTEIFKTQLQKIVSEKHTLKAGSEFVTDKNVEEIKDSRASKRKKKAKKTDVVENSPPVEIIEDCVLEDSIEFLEQVPGKEVRQGTRRSQRLKKTYVSNMTDSDIESPVTRRVTRGRRKGGKKEKKSTAVSEVILDDSPKPPENLEEELNPEVSVKVIWKSVNIKKFQIRQFQKLSKIFELISQEEEIPEDKIMLTFNGVKVNRNDTPDSLNLQVYHFLDGGVLSELTNPSESYESKVSDCDGDAVNLKFQDANKKIVNLKLHKDDKMKVAMIKYSEQMEIPLGKIKFFFDGDLLEASETPFTLGLENDEIIDIKISS